MIIIGFIPSIHAMNLSSALVSPLSKLCTPSGYAFLAAGGCYIGGKVCDWVSDCGVIVFDYVHRARRRNHGANPPSDVDKNNLQQDEHEGAEEKVGRWAKNSSLGLKLAAHAAYFFSVSGVAAGGLLLLSKK